MKITITTTELNFHDTLHYPQDTSLSQKFEKNKGELTTALRGLAGGYQHHGPVTARVDTICALIPGFMGDYII